MKERVSATIDPETKKALEKIMDKKRYRNVSHAIEESIMAFWEKVKNEK